MNEPSGVSESGSDAELLNTIRSGDPGSADLLRERHAAAARRLGGHLEQEPAAADDLVARAFAQVLDAIQRGGGPSDAFRPYLLTAVRRAARDGGGSAQLPTDEQHIPDPGQPLIDPTPGRAVPPVVTAFLSLPERWRAVLWHTEIEGATPAEAAPLLGLPAAEVVDLADRARDGLRREYSQLQQPGCGLEDADLAEVGSALRATVAPAILGAAATAYLADLASSAAVSSAAVSPAAVSSGGSASAGTASASASDLAPAGAGSWARTAGSSLTGRIRGSSAQQRTFAVGTVALLAMFALGGYALAQSPATGSTTTSGQRTAAVPVPSSPTSPALPPTAPTSGGPARGGVGSTGRTPAPGKSGGSPTPAAPAADTAPPAAPAVPSPPVPSRPTASQPAPSQPAPSQPAPTQPARGQPTPTPSTPSRPTPVGSGPAATQVIAQISVADPVGLSNLAEITFGIADAGPVVTGPLTASIAMPPDSKLLSAWSGPGIIGWQCSTAGNSTAGNSTTCVHDPIGATVRTSGFLAVAVTGPAACGQSVRVTITGGAAVTSAQSTGTIQCAPSLQFSAADGHAPGPPTPDPRATPDAIPAAGPSQSTGPWWRAGRHRTHSPWPGGPWPGKHWPGRHWPRDPWAASPWRAGRWPGR
jgi:DNA-directed RNA polymerase specialized sigma24 family protein